MDKQNYYLVNLLLINLKYSELKKLRDDGLLIPGYQYRITDYVTTTTQAETKSAGNVFDVIVLAVSANELSHIARAIQHEGDTYFDGNDLSAWELWYDLDNDTEKYEWADATNGKGVIYRMIDEKKNDCPCDFKNILFYNTKLKEVTTSDRYYYTFSYVVGGKLYDGTVEKQALYCQDNNIGMRLSNKKMSLHMNVFRNVSFGTYCQDNIFGSGCSSNTFDSGCHHNIFGSGCSSNTFDSGCHHNIFGNECFGNTLGHGFRDNIFGSGCSSNTFGNACFNVTFGNSFQYRRIYKEKTSLTFNEEYYDDGSGQLVPIKHPDLSTQPSILPYKFMGQYVYEQLIFLGEFDKDSTEINRLILHNELTQRNVCIIKCEGFVFGDFTKAGKETNSVSYVGDVGIPITLSIKTEILNPAGDFSITGSIPSDLALIAGDSLVLGMNSRKVYARIVYTITPEEGGYYGYNEY